MPTPIKLTAGQQTFAGHLNDSPTAKALTDALPLEAPVQTWGEEIYFKVPVAAEQAPDARTTLDVGELAYWPPGQALCVFFGSTPASGADGKPVAAGEVNPVGQLDAQPEQLRAVTQGQTVRVERAE